MLLPVGQALGPFHPARGAAARHHVVRVGWDTPKLTGDREVQTWQAAHRVERSALDPDVVAGLLARGLLVEVTRTPTGLEEFARRHRVQVQLLGQADVDDRHPVGLLGSAPVALLDDETFEFWAWGHLFADLWAAAQGLASVTEQTGTRPLGAPGLPDPASGPGDLLDRIVADLPRLIDRGVLYLDVRRSPV